MGDMIFIQTVKCRSPKTEARRPKPEAEARSRSPKPKKQTEEKSRSAEQEHGAEVRSRYQAKFIPGEYGAYIKYVYGRRIPNGSFEN